MIVTTRAKDKDDAMAVAWHAAISKNPPLYGISVTEKRLTYELIVESGEFAINFMPYEKAELVASVGGVSGRQTDKFEQFGMVKEEALKISVPLLKEAYACYECKLVDRRSCGDHVWVVGEVVATQFEKEVFGESGELKVAGVDPVLYTGSDHYATTLKDSARYLDRAVFGRKGRA